MGLSLHRPEMIPLMAERMQRQEAVFLEEPPAPGFNRMLNGELKTDDYLMQLDVEYPKFSQAMCDLMRRLHSEGIRFHQVEPFVEGLIHIQEFFADGHRPDELAPDSLLHHVYRAERAATGALLNYYQAASTGSFDHAIEAVIRFARVDAARFRLRDSLRAQELARIIPAYASCYVEAGQMHYQLWLLLRNLLPTSVQVQPVFLADAALRSVNRHSRFYAPGDQLTLLYIFRPKVSQPERENLLAARSMIYSKILEKQEWEANGGEPFPHLRDELACIHAVRQLSLGDCRSLFAVIRRSGTQEARRILTAFLAARNYRSGWVLP